MMVGHIENEAQCASAKSPGLNTDIWRGLGTGPVLSYGGMLSFWFTQSLPSP